MQLTLDTWCCSWNVYSQPTINWKRSIAAYKLESLIFRFVFQSY